MSLELLERRRNMMATFSDQEPTYVKAGLVLHLDGRNQGNVVNSWIDSIGSKEFVFSGSPTVHYDSANEPDGVTFANYGDCAICPTALRTAHTSGTIEICFTPLEGFVDETTPTVVDGLKRMYYMRTFYMTEFDNNICAMLNVKSSSRIFYYSSYKSKYGTPTAKRYLQNEITAATTISLNHNRLVVDGIEDTTSPSTAKIGGASSGSGMCIGGMVSDWYASYENNVNRVYLSRATIHEIRVYNRKLSTPEILKNQRLDNIRYNLGISALT